VLEYAQRIIRRAGAHPSAIQVRSLPLEDLFQARLGSPAIQVAHGLIDGAEALIIVTPLCRSICSGALKAFLDLLPHHALSGKAILPIITGGAPCSLSIVDEVLHPLLAARGAGPILGSVTIADAQIQFAHGGGLELEGEIDAQLRRSIADLIAPFQPPTSGKVRAQARSRSAGYYH
jgi:FMN reductase